MFINNSFQLYHFTSFTFKVSKKKDEENIYRKCRTSEVIFINNLQ